MVGKCIWSHALYSPSISSVSKNSNNVFVFYHNNIVQNNDHNMTTGYSSLETEPILVVKSTSMVNFIRWRYLMEVSPKHSVCGYDRLQSLCFSLESYVTRTSRCVVFLTDKTNMYHSVARWIPKTAICQIGSEVLHKLFFGLFKILFSFHCTNNQSLRACFVFRCLEGKSKSSCICIVVTHGYGYK